MKRRKTYNKYDKSREEVKSEPKILTEDEKKRKEKIRKLLSQMGIMNILDHYK